VTFPVALGATIARSDLHDLLGGRLRTRISPSSVTDNVFAFTSPGRPDSRLDGWTGQDDQHFHFTGEGRPGADHSDGRGNGALAGHVAAGRTLHLLRRTGPGETARYLGTWEVDADLPWVRTDLHNPARPHEPSISVLVFRLRPLNAMTDGLPTTAAVPVRTVVAEADLYAPFRPHSTHTPRTDTNTIEAAAQRLLRDYRDHLCNLGDDVRRYQLSLAGTLDQVPVDLMDRSRNEVVAASGSVARFWVLTGIGELNDIRRHFNPTPGLLLLLPSLPRPDLVDLCSAAHVTIVYPEGHGGFCRIPPRSAAPACST